MPDSDPSPDSRTLEVFAQCAGSSEDILLGVGGTIFRILDVDVDDNDYVNQCLELQYRIQEEEPTCSYFKVVFKGFAPDLDRAINVKNIKFRPYDAVGQEGVCSKSSNFCCRTMSLDLCS